MSQQIDLPSTRQQAAPVASQATAVEQARAVAEVAAAVRVAQDFPRDQERAVSRMRQSCGHKALADRAFYSLPRAGGRVEGSTVHLARELAACWGNVDYGIREMRRDDDEGVSEMQAWAWDQETNTRSSRSFIVPHARMTGKGGAKKRERLIDLGDIANNNNSVAARAVRETIFTVLPIWFVADAEGIAAETLSGPTVDSREQQIDEAITHFRDTFNVTRDQLEARVQRKVAEWTPQDLAVLRVVASEIARGEKRVEDHFPVEQATSSTADDVAALTAAGAPEEPTS